MARTAESRRRSPSPVVETLALLGLVLVLQTGLWLLGRPGVLALGPDVGRRPWALVTTVYAHTGPAHLLGNAVVFLLVGPLVARRTTRGRFHAFFLGTGVLAAVAELVVGSTLGRPPLVLGASGAVLALVGYVLAGNVLTERLLARLSLSPRVQVVVLGVVVVAVTVLTGGPGVALVAHATGFALGTVAGRARLLEAAG
jgi:membrane associated rhomboid family serine protease